MIGDAGSILIFDGSCGFCTSVAAWSARRFHHGETAEALQLLDVGVLDQHGLSSCPGELRRAESLIANRKAN